MRIEDEIKQEKFKSEYHKLNVNLLYTVAWINQNANDTLKPYNISWQQFNILRILKGRHPEPATIKLLSERMIDKMSNASRLVEKLRQKGYVERIECELDRRQVDITLTALGLENIEKASTEMEQAMNQQFKHVTNAEAIAMNEILDRIRDSY